MRLVQSVNFHVRKEHDLKEPLALNVIGMVLGTWMLRIAYVSIIILNIELVNFIYLSILNIWLNFF